MEQCALELGTLWGAATIDENFASINPSSPITCLSRWSKNPFREAKWAFYVPPLRLEEAHRQKHTVVGTHKRRHHKWEVSVSLRGLTLISWQRNTWPLFYFYQDHLRIDQVPTSLWHRHENKINSDVLFIYFSSTISVTLWAASISGCLRSPGNIDAKSPFASVKQSDGGTFAPAPLPCSRSLRLILNSITIFHIHLFSFSLVTGYSFFILPSPSISTSANLTPHLVQPSSALGLLVEHPLNSGL